MKRLVEGKKKEGPHIRGSEEIQTRERRKIGGRERMQTREEKRRIGGREMMKTREERRNRGRRERRNS